MDSYQLFQIFIAMLIGTVIILSLYYVELTLEEKEPCSNKAYVCLNESKNMVWMGKFFSTITTSKEVKCNESYDIIEERCFD